MSRALSDEFINDLKDGILSGVLNRVKKDTTLNLEFREDGNKYIDIYYRGCRLLNIEKRKKCKFKFDINKKYFEDDKNLRKFLEKNSNINEESDVNKWLDKIPILKDKIDLHFLNDETNTPREREWQQQIIKENNYRLSGNHQERNDKNTSNTDYFIIDMEANKEGKYDLIGAKWPSKSRNVKNPKLDLALIELKYGDKKLDNENSGITKHFNDMCRTIENRVKALQDEMLKIFNQKVNLGLIHCSDKEIASFSDNIEMVFIFINYKPASGNLEQTLIELKEKYNAKDYNFDLKIGCSNFMGGALNKESIYDIDYFLDKFKNQLGNNDFN